MDGWMKEGEAHIYGDEITNHIQKSSSQRLHTASILGVFRLDALTSERARRPDPSPPLPSLPVLRTHDG